MKKLLVIILGVFLTLSVAADHHKDSKRDSRAMDIFEMADSDKDGKVSYAEHESFVAMQADKGRESFNRMDSDSDGYITKQEAQKVRKKLKKKKKKDKKGRKDRIRKKNTKVE